MHRLGVGYRYGKVSEWAVPLLVFRSTSFIVMTIGAILTLGDASVFYFWLSAAIVASAGMAIFSQ
jgi:hypothetical protein